MRAISLNYFTLITIILVSVSVSSLGIQDLCGKLDRNSLKLFGTGEAVSWDIALRTTDKTTQKETAADRVRIAEGADLFPGIDQSQKPPTDDSDFRAVVREEILSAATVNEVNAIQKLFKKPFMPTFLGCQYEGITVYIAEEDLSHLPQLDVWSDKALHQILPKFTRLGFYKQIFEAIGEIESAGFVNSQIEPSTLSYVIEEDGSATLRFRGYSFLPLKSDLSSVTRNVKFWRPESFASTAQVTAFDSMFAAAVAIVEMEHKAKDSLFDLASNGDSRLFLFNNLKHQTVFLEEAAEVLEEASFGKKIGPSEVGHFELNTFTNFIMAILVQDDRVATTAEALSLLRVIHKNEETIHNYKFSGREFLDDQELVIPLQRRDTNRRDSNPKKKRDRIFI